jgi:hypothetical protein
MPVVVRLARKVTGIERKVRQMSPKKRYGARHKLNAAFIVGALVVSGFLGAAFSSWNVFAVVLVCLVGVAIAAGSIR